MLFDPTKVCAIPTIVPASDASPWWYAECSETYPASCATLISFLMIDLPRLKHAYRILRCPGLRPSTIDGIERTLSAFEKWMSSLSMNVV